VVELEYLEDETKDPVKIDEINSQIKRTNQRSRGATTRCDED